MELRPGQIVEMRKRLWRIDEFDNYELHATPINGDFDDKRVFLRDIEDIKLAELEKISSELVGDFQAQRMLQYAYRFDLMHGSAPFLSLQRSAVIPYNYQLVPLILALEKPTARILIADDVGLGKTIEAGLIISELIQRGKIKRILILTPANLKEQWQESLDYFFHLDAKIISSLTRKEFEKQLPAGANPWQYFQIVIASFDYAKAPEVKHLIMEQKWDLLLMDEVHICAMPHATQRSQKQMRRYELLKHLGAKIPNVLLLTATPHNGYTDSFSSILEVLNKEIVIRHSDHIRLDKQAAKFNVCQRNRKKLEEWYKQQDKPSPFPQRQASEVFVDVTKSKKFNDCFEAVLDYGDNLLAKNQESTKLYNIATWVAFHLQKRAISSPLALIRSIENRVNSIDDNKGGEESDEDILSGCVQDLFYEERITDEMASSRLDKELMDENEKIKLAEIYKLAKAIKPTDDIKLQSLKNEVLPKLFVFDNKVIIFTKYKDTLDYLQENLSASNFDVLIIHGDYSFRKRQEVFLKFELSTKAVLIATDVISEGLNLQRLSSCIIHYELPWNPNRLEQRNGRVDRIGQLKETVQIRTFVLDKTLDKDILDLLITKANRIRHDRGYSAAYFGDEDYIKSVLDEANLRSKQRRKKPVAYQGPTLFDETPFNQVRTAVKKSIDSEEDARRLKKIDDESFYDSLNIDLPEIDKRISETVSIVGSRTDVEIFVKTTCSFFNSVIKERKDGFQDIILNDQRLVLSKYGNKLEKITFDTEVGLTHPDAIVLEIGHPFVRRLIELVKSEFFGKNERYGRNAFYFSEQASSVCFIFNVLVRFTVGLHEKRVMEELLTIGIDGFTNSLIDETEVRSMVPAITTESIDEKHFKEYLEHALSIPDFTKILNKKIEERRLKLIKERQELYKKIIKEAASGNDDKWFDEIIYIDNAGSDILTISIVLPHSK
jgi:superfamily II DNA or RNA helicase